MIILGAIFWIITIYLIKITLSKFKGESSLHEIEWNNSSVTLTS